MAWLGAVPAQDLIAYKDRDLVTNHPDAAGIVTPRRDIFSHYLVLDGWLVGTWRRTVTSGAISLEIVPYRTLTSREQSAVGAAARRHGAFVNRPATLASRPPAE